VPSFRIETPAVSLSIFDVVGEDGAQPDFISHAGLAQSTDSQKADAVIILDMGPPLRGQNRPNSIEASAVGCAALSDDEVQKIRTFVDQHANEHQVFLHLNASQMLRLAAQMYCIYPHADPLFEDDGRYARMRFSCSGFVFEAYRSARIRLLEPDALPTVDMTTIEAAYPVPARLLAASRVTPDSLGLKGNGPWPVLLCGYLFHALDREADVIRQSPYTPVGGDQYFPRHQQVA
jgi:hypothetical protein